MQKNCSFVSMEKKKEDEFQQVLRSARGKPIVLKKESAEIYFLAQMTISELSVYKYKAKTFDAVESTNILVSAQ